MISVRHNSPKYNKTQQVHTKTNIQGVQSTLVKEKVVVKNKNSDTDEDERPNNKRDIFVNTYFSKDTVYTNKTGIFPVLSYQGSKYIILCVK